MSLAWKPNWEETKQHFTDWWHHRGFVIATWGAPLPEGQAQEETVRPDQSYSLRNAHCDGSLRARLNHYKMSRQYFPVDAMPVADTTIGPGSLALYLGSEAKFEPTTIWYEPNLHECSDPEGLPPFTFDESNSWWKITESVIKECLRLSPGKYMVGCPDLVENLDILASLRTPEVLMMDLLDRPEWVEKKVAEINQVWFKAYQRIYDLIKLDDGSAAFVALQLWGPGKTAKLQCDCSAMFSPEMFDRFVLPALKEQCAWLDFSMYHLDGPKAICHLDTLLKIEDLDAVQWSSGAGNEGGGSARWFPMYKRILDAGKSVQIIGAKLEEIPPLVKAIGTKGVYIRIFPPEDKDVAGIISLAEKYW